MNEGAATSIVLWRLRIGSVFSRSVMILAKQIRKCRSREGMLSSVRRTVRHGHTHLDSLHDP